MGVAWWGIVARQITEAKLLRQGIRAEEYGKEREILLKRT